MPYYTTSHSTKKRPTYRKGPSDHLPSAHKRRPRKPGAQYLRHSQGFGRRSSRQMNKRRPANSRRPYAFIAVGCALLFFIASLIWYANRSVDITLNGDTVKARINSSLEQLITDQGLEPTPGKLLAVDDSVLDKRGGERVSVKLNGKQVDDDKLLDTKLQEHDEVEVANGRDEYEPHEVQATTIAPQLVVKGSGAIEYVTTWGVPGRSEVWTGKTSGKIQDRGVLKEAVDCVVTRRSVSPDVKGKQYVALTFDEGPSEYTEQIVRILKEKKASATFFLSGDAVEAHPAAAKAIADAGFEIGSNSYEDKGLAELTAPEARKQLEDGFSAIEKATGVRTALLRAPFAAFNEQNWADAMDMVGAVVSWNVDSGDWLVPGADAVVQSVLDSVSDGSIVLLTDGASTGKQAVEALPSLIDELRAAGYEVVGLSELIATDHDLVDELPSASTVSMPEDAVLPTVAKEEE